MHVYRVTAQDWTQEMELILMLFRRRLHNFTKTSRNHHSKYLHFQSSIPSYSKLSIRESRPSLAPSSQRVAENSALFYLSFFISKYPTHSIRNVQWKLLYTGLRFRGQLTYSSLLSLIWENSWRSQKLLLYSVWPSAYDSRNISHAFPVNSVKRKLSPSS